MLLQTFIPCDMDVLLRQNTKSKFVIYTLQILIDNIINTIAYTNIPLSLK